MAATTSIASAIEEIVDARSDLACNGFEAAPAGFQRIVECFDAEPLRSAITAQVPSFEFDAWWDVGTGGGRSMHGSAALVWPSDIGSRVAAQIGLCRRFAADGPALLGYMYRVIGADGNLDDRLREVLQRVVDPLVRDLRKLSARRVSPPTLDVALQTPIPRTGDARLDEMIEEARSKFRDCSLIARKEGLERLWDAFERMKSLLSPEDKRDSAKLLIDLVATEPHFRAELDAEARTLTSIGNQFQIRHHEKGKVPLETSDQVDYLFHRCFALVWLCSSTLSKRGNQ
jgi:hypothetical protein